MSKPIEHIEYDELIPDPGINGVIRNDIKKLMFFVNSNMNNIFFYIHNNIMYECFYKMGDIRLPIFYKHRNKWKIDSKTCKIENLNSDITNYLKEGIFNDEGIEIANTDVVYIEYYGIRFRIDPENDSLFISLYGIDERMTPVYYHIKEYISISKDKIVVLCNSQNTVVKDVDILVTYNMKEKSIYIRSFTHYLRVQGNIRNTGIYQKIKQKE